MVNKSQYHGDYCSEIVERHGNTIYKICRLHLKNQADVEDVFQQVFLKLIKKQPNFKDTDHERAWLIKVAVNSCKDFLKSYWNKNTISIDSYDAKVENEKLSEVFDVVATLEPNYKMVIYMYYNEGYTTSEISKILKVNEATIRTRLKRARMLLRIKLEGDNFYE